jgi:hypothetical protein
MWDLLTEGMPEKADELNCKEVPMVMTSVLMIVSSALAAGAMVSCCFGQDR